MKAERSGCCFGVLLSLCLCSQIWAFPGSQLSLIENWSASSLVVTAKVESVKEVKNRRDIVLSIQSVLKEESAAGTDTLRFSTSANAWCAGPFHFKQGRQMIVFLTLDAETRQFTPTSYTGCIEVDEQGMRDYSAKIQQLPAIVSESHPKRKNEKQLDWYVGCAELPGTRSVGTVGIAYYQRSGALRKLVLPEIQQRLLTALLSERPPGKDASKLALVLSPYPSQELDRFLLECLRRSHEPGWEDVTETAVETLPDRLGVKLDASLKERLALWEELALVVHNDLDPESNVDDTPETRLLYKQQKQRLDILWGQLTAEIHAVCQQVMENRE